MKARCNNPNNVSYRYYGGRGITYCDKWETFTGFWEDMKNSWKQDYTIDRIDSNKNYCKENCQWLNRSEHARKDHF